MSGWRDSAARASDEIGAAIMTEGDEALGYLRSAQQRIDNALEALEDSLSEDDHDHPGLENEPGLEDDPDE